MFAIVSIILFFRSLECSFKFKEFDNPSNVSFTSSKLSNDSGQLQNLSIIDMICSASTLYISITYNSRLANGIGDEIIVINFLNASLISRISKTSFGSYNRNDRRCNADFCTFTFSEDKSRTDRKSVV